MLKSYVVSTLKSDVESTLKICCFPNVDINNVSKLKIGCSTSRPKINLKNNVETTLCAGVTLKIDPIEKRPARSIFKLEDPGHFSTVEIWPEVTFQQFVPIRMSLDKFINDIYYFQFCVFWICSGGRVVKLLACGARGPGSIPGLATWIFRDWLSPASKSRYGWKIAKSTLILKTTNQQPEFVWPLRLGWLLP